jgi:hypothetical protein
MTMSKSFLQEDIPDASVCTCPDCAAERDVPLTFKLQFLDEAAEQKQKSAKKKNKKKGDESKFGIEGQQYVLHSAQFFLDSCTSLFGLSLPVL